MGQGGFLPGGYLLADFGDLEAILDDRVEFRPDDIRRCPRARRNQGVAVAVLAREALGPDSGEPVRDICGLLESGGLPVIEPECSTVAIACEIA